jgi:alanyl-tRNA synthetase
MTDRLYYYDSSRCEFEGEVVEVIPATEINRRHGVVLDRTAFYPTSGGQVHDTGFLITTSDDATRKLRVAEVVELEDGRVVHYIEADRAPQKGTKVYGEIDPQRRRDHMQQHSGQHVLSAAFVRLFNMPTVSFHMGEEYCSIDLDTPSLSAQQVEEAEALANQVVQENRRVAVRFVSQEDAATHGLRNLPTVAKDELRLIDIQDFDLTPCGGTHVRGTGQIGAILLRKIERVRQGWRVEFVSGQRAVATARRDYSTLTVAAGLLSTNIWELPQQVRKSLDEVKAARKTAEQLLEEVADLQAATLLSEAPAASGRKVIVRVWKDRDLRFVKLLAQKLTRRDSGVVALLGSTRGQPSLVFTQSPGLPFDMGALLQRTVASLGGRGGGNKDLAQGGVPHGTGLEEVLSEVASGIPR